MLLGNKLYQSHPNVFNKSRNPMVDPKTAYPLPSDGRPYFFHNGAWVPESKKLAQNNLGNQQEFVFSEWQVPNHAVLKDLYAQELTFAEDAALIAGLTAANDKVALISSFEVAILIQAKRKPFIFQFPLIVSRAMTIRSLPQTNILTKQGLRRAIGDFEKYKPEYIFMERMFLQTDIPSAYLNDAAELLALLDYVKTHYTPVQVGKYLVAMKRNQH